VSLETIIPTPAMCAPYLIKKNPPPPPSSTCTGADLEA